MSYLIGYIAINLLAVVLGAPLLLGIRLNRMSVLYALVAIFFGVVVVAAVAVHDAVDRARTRRRRRGVS